MDISPNRGAPTDIPQVGTRVMIRRRLSPEEISKNTGTLHEHTTLTDVVGVIQERSTTHIMVATRSTIVSVDIANIVAIKQIPATTTGRRAPHRSIGTAALERIAAAGWRATQEEPLGDWVLRYGGGYTGRANSCLALGEPHMPLSHALDAVADWYAVRGQKPLIHLALDRGVPASADPFVGEAVNFGWQVSEQVSVMTASTDEVLACTEPRSDGDIAVTEKLTDIWWSLADDRMLERPDAARAVLEGSRQVFLTAAIANTGVARARLALHTPWAGLFALYTSPERRGQGLGAAILHKSATYAQENGIHSLYLQVATSNTAAIRLYERAGFTEHHQYIYLAHE